MHGRMPSFPIFFSVQLNWSQRKLFLNKSYRIETRTTLAHDTVLHAAHHVALKQGLNANRTTDQLPELLNLWCRAPCVCVHTRPNPPGQFFPPNLCPCCTFHRQLPFNTEATWSIGQPLGRWWSFGRSCHFLCFMSIAVETALIHHNILFKLLREGECQLKS